MYNPNFKVPSAGKPISRHYWEFIKRKLNYTPQKPRLTGQQRKAQKLEERAIKMLRRATHRPSYYRKEMEKAVKESQLMEYIAGANPE